MGLPVAAQGVLVTYKLRECNGLGSKGSIHHHVVGILGGWAVRVKHSHAVVR